MASSLEKGFRRADGTVALTYAFSAITCNYKYPLYEAFYISKTLLHKNKEKRARSDPSGKNRTWIWFEPIGSATLTESDIKAFRERFVAEIKPKTLTDKPLTREEISEIREVSKRLRIKRSSLHKLLELCMRERPSVFPFIRNQVGRRVWSEEDAKLIGKYVEAGKILEFMEVYELEIGRERR
ncbi:MAG TPA: hypothetical protein EYP19_07940 [Desulfobacterales bacterium]|nr:hypothetical protein [Desulfobacterales bacterium]